MTTIGSRLLACIMIIGILAGCGSSDDDGGSSVNPCKCEFLNKSESNGLNIIFEQQTVKQPANVSVMFKVERENGEPIPNLLASDFKLYENDALISQFESQQTIVPKPGNFISRTLLLMDLSGSILQSDSLTKLKEAAASFVRNTMPNENSIDFGAMDMAVYWFDGSANIYELVPFVTDADRLIAGIDSIHEDISADSSTNLYGAIISGINRTQTAVANSSATVSVGSIILFTDGKDQAARVSKENAINAVKNAGKNISIYTIGLGGEIDEMILKDVGRDGFVFAVDLDELVPKFEEIANKIREDVNSHYLLEYCSPKRAGSHILKIVVNENDKSGTLMTCFCATGFQGGCKITGVQIVRQSLQYYNGGVR